MSGAPIVHLRGVTKEYPLGATTVRALDDVSLTVAKGEMVALVGPSGSGKSTLLNLVGCVDVPTRGEVAIDGTATTGLSDKRLTRLRLTNVGFVFQSFNLIPVLSVYLNVELPLLLAGGVSSAERRRRVIALLDRVGLADYGARLPRELSGGQRQRVAIARALVSAPRLVLADEPTANLDSATGQSILELLAEMNRTDEATIIFSTHDPRARVYARRVVELTDGRLAEPASPVAAVEG